MDALVLSVLPTQTPVALWCSGDPAGVLWGQWPEQVGQPGLRLLLLFLLPVSLCGQAAR